MKGVTADLFGPKLGDIKPDAIVVPTNLQRKGDGSAVMGAGVALEAAKRWPLLPELLGMRLGYHGDHVYAVWPDPNGRPVVCFPTKRDWRALSDLDLIERSAAEMVRIAGLWSWKVVALPRVGCGLGGLRWEDVRPVLERHLDDRFVVVHPEGQG